MIWFLLFVGVMYAITAECLRGIFSDIKEIIKYLKNK
jgi:hypothetical protein